MTTATQQRARVGDMLVARGVITEQQLAHALEVQKQGHQDRLLGEILVDQGYANKEQVLAALAEARGVPFARLTPELVDPAIRTALPEAFIRKQGVLPLFRVRDVLTVAMAEPSNLFLADEIAHSAGLNVQIVAATPDNIYQMIEYGQAQTPAPAPAQERPAAAPTAEADLAADYDLACSDWPPEKLAGLLVSEALGSRASAIHLEPDEKVLRIRFNIDGVLHIIMRPPTRLAAGLAGAFDAMMGRAGGEAPVRGQPRSARIVVQGKAVQLHLACLEGAFGPRAVVQVVTADEAQMSLEKLGCDFALLALYRAALAQRRGIVLIAAPRGGGATTTLYSTLNALDPIRLNICTFESCINFNLPGINQFSPATCGTAETAAALEQILLQQPDVLALDVNLDEAAAARAVEAALDGCLVLARVRAADAADAVARLASRTGPEKPASSLRMVLAQRLVRVLCPQCRHSYEPPAPLRRRVAETLGPVEEYFKGRGCANCQRTGFLGRIGLFELVPIEGALVDRIRSGADPAALRAAIRAAGHPSLWVDGANKVRAGITSAEEVVDALSSCPAEAPAPVAARA